MELDSGSDDGSDEEYLGETEESTDTFDEAEYVDEMQHGRHILKLDSALAPGKVERMGLRPSALQECGEERYVKTEVSQLYCVLKPCLPDKWDQRRRWGHQEGTMPR
ncbi:hypothetical protein PIB30_001625 [Stylosanthes scabra]|uniref:Uncharacterized protein n=1 Tax=Stylosanthes scabra TaxID=79078 RepID=A0ABU6S2Q8_9FABA|nr:hypothetical protein [Stylosanthes scabra]